jgi:hypothetical protein
MTDVLPEVSDVRLAAQERLLDAVLRVIAVRDPGFTDAVRGVLVDTVQTHSEYSPSGGTVTLHVAQRLRAAEKFAEDYSGRTLA